MWAFSHVSNGAVIGRNCVIGEGVHIGPNVLVGDGCKIQNGAQLYEGAIIEDQVFVGPCAVITHNKWPWAWESPHPPFEKTVLETGCSIGANATIIGGVRIGRLSMVGAGSVVSKNVGDMELVAGVPAVLVRRIDDELAKSNRRKLPQRS